MRSRVRIAMLLVALVAMLSVASSPALAKGGGGGGGGGGGNVCATFSSYAVSTTAFDATRASLNVDYAVAYSCFDESWPPLSFTLKNESTGQTGTQVYFGPILPGLHTQTFGVAYNTKYTITTKLTQASNGAVQ